jgi:hypothetical protein
MLFALRRQADLWLLITSPSVWALHFLACYVLAAVHCAKGGQATVLGSTVPWIAGLTIVALIVVAVTGANAFRHWGFGANSPPHDAPTAQDRRRFIGYATLLVSALSFVSIVFTALPVLFVADCR